MSGHARRSEDAVNALLRDRRYLVYAVLISVVGAALRALSVPPVLGDLDGVNFARGLAAFDPLHQAPHFPGYPVRIACASAVRELGASLGASEVWAIALPGILLWPMGSVLMFVGLRRLLGVAPAMAAVIAGSLAPGAVLVAGWPGSDGLGLALLAAAVGAFGLGTAGRIPHRGRWLWAAGALLGLGLGVRLAWLPLTIGLSVVFLVNNRSAVARVFAGIAVGAGAWFLPLLWIVGPGALFETAWGFTAGHFSSWGGTAFSHSAPLTERLGLASASLWHGASGIPSASYAQLMGAGLLAVASVAGCLAWRRLHIRASLWGVLAVAGAYAAWILLGQNLEKVRHLVPLMLCLAVLLGAAVAKTRLAPWIAGAVTACLLVGSTSWAWQQARMPPPAASLVRHVVRSYSPQDLQVFSGQEARLFEYYAPGYRAVRPASGEVLRVELQRLRERGVKVLMSSATPGIHQFRHELRTVARFEGSPVVRGPGTSLVLYEWAPRAVVSVGGQP